MFFESLVPIFLWLVFLFFDFSKHFFCSSKFDLKKCELKCGKQWPSPLEAVHCTLHKSWNLQKLQPSQAWMLCVTNSLPRLQPAKARVKACILVFTHQSLQKLKSIFHGLQPSQVKSFYWLGKSKKTKSLYWLPIFWLEKAKSLYWLQPAQARTKAHKAASTS